VEGRRAVQPCDLHANKSPAVSIRFAPFDARQCNGRCWERSRIEAKIYRTASIRMCWTVIWS